MHLAEIYALTTGSKISKPFIVKKFFPVGCDKYITIHNSSGMLSKCYDYFQEVIDILNPYLEQNNIKVVQIGGQNDEPIDKAIHLHGKTNINQTAYIINNSLLHIGNDSFAVHMASAFGIPLIALYSITSPEIAGPFWKNKNQICLCPPDFRPSFNPNESPKKVNQIKIEDIVNNALEILFNIKSSYKTINIGERFKEKIIECLPDQIIHPDFFKGHVLNIRLDLSENFELKNIAQNLALRPCCLITDKEIDIQPLLQFKNNISCVIYDITNSINKEFLNLLHSSGIKYHCVFNKDNFENDIQYNTEIQKRKEITMDYCTIKPFNKISKNIDFDYIFSSKQNFIIKSNRIFLANQKVYTGESAYMKDLPVDPSKGLIQNLEDLKSNDNTYLKHDLQYHFVYENNS